MRFLHLGDLHLGKSLGDFDLAEDQEYLLNQLLDIVDEKYQLTENGLRYVVKLNENEDA